MHGHEAAAEQRILSKNRLDNGVELEFQDLSRRIAGDRWNVRLRAEVYLPPELCKATFLKTASDAITDGSDEIRKWLTAGLTVSFNRERHFIANRDVTATLQSCEEELRETILRYVRTKAFVAGVIAKHCREQAQNNKIAALLTVAIHDEIEETAPEPVDFSDCFRA